MVRVASGSAVDRSCTTREVTTRRKVRPVIQPKAKAMPFFGVWTVPRMRIATTIEMGLRAIPSPRGSVSPITPPITIPSFASPLAPDGPARWSGPRRSIAHEEVPQRPGDDGDDQRSQDGGEDAVDHDTSTKEPQGEPARRRQDDRADDEPEEA